MNRGRCKNKVAEVNVGEVVEKKITYAKELFANIAKPGRRLISGKLVPVLKIAVDENDDDLVVSIAKRYPNTFGNARAYIGKRRNARVDEILARLCRG